MTKKIQLEILEIVNRNQYGTHGFSEKVQKQWTMQTANFAKPSSFLKNPVSLEGKNVPDISDSLEKVIKEMSTTSNMQEFLYSKNECKLFFELTEDLMIIKDEKGNILFQKDFLDLEKTATKVKDKTSICFSKLQEALVKEENEQIKRRNIVPQGKSEENRVTSRFNSVVSEALKKKTKEKASFFAKREATFILTVDNASVLASFFSSVSYAFAKPLTELSKLVKAIASLLMKIADLEGDKIELFDVAKENIRTPKKFFKKLGSKRSFEVVLKVLGVVIGIAMFIAAAAMLLSIVVSLPGASTIGTLFGMFLLDYGLYNVVAIIGIVYGSYKVYHSYQFRKELQSILNDDSLTEYEKYKKYMLTVREKISVNEKNEENTIRDQKANKWQLNKNGKWKDFTDSEKNTEKQEGIDRKIKRKIRKNIRDFKSLTNDECVSFGFLENINRIASTLNIETKNSPTTKDLQKAIEEAKALSKKIDKASYLTMLKNIAFLVLDGGCLLGNAVALWGGPTLNAMFWGAIAQGYLTVDMLDIKGEKITNKIYQWFREKDEKQEKTNTVAFEVILQKDQTPRAIA